MIKWELLDSAEIPGTTSYMTLMRRGQELVIRVDERDLMSNRTHGSEDALADLVIDRLEKGAEKKPDLRVLIGGLGLGFTLAAALKRVGKNAQVVVAELVPAIVEWNRGVLGEPAGRPIEDHRASIFHGDVADQIKNPLEPWDAILLDVDNGPDALTAGDNDWLYTWDGLKAAHAALSPDGILAIWSAAPSDAFTRLVNKVGFKSEPLRVRARGDKGGRPHIIWICEKR